MAKGRISVLEEYCKSCGLCVEACPVKVLRISDHINSKGYRPVEQFKDCLLYTSLPRNEWSHRSLVEAKEAPSVGDPVRVRVVSLKQGEESQLVVSRWRIEFDERWDAMESSLAEGDVLEVRGLRKVKGGLIVDCCGIEGFVPVSHLAEEGRGCLLYTSRCV